MLDAVALAGSFVSQPREECVKRVGIRRWQPCDIFENLLGG